jgi:propionyl-CoA carboxylase alpha chain
VEFLVDENLNFYFLEMNTRLQVEHPVTELITGVDLVKEQISVAMGNKLSFAQSELRINGHAIEIRVYAEDPENNFLPDVGNLKTYRLPSGNGVRVDGGFEEGMEVPIYYDPMLAKLIVHAENREAAIEKMLRAIADYEVAGVTTTLNFCRFALEHEAFRSGKFDTHFVKNHFNIAQLEQKLNNEESEAAALFMQWLKNNYKTASSATPSEEHISSTWQKNRLVLR